MESTEPVSSPDARLPIWARGLLVSAVAIAVGWAWGTGQLEALDLAGLRLMVESAGTTGPIVYVLAFGLLQPIGVSAHLFLVVAGLVWPATEAIVWTQLGLNLSSVTSYGFGRVLAPDALRARIPARVLVWEERLCRGGLTTVIAARLVFFSFFPLSALMGAMRIPFRNYALGSFIGYIPVAVAEVLLASRLVDWISG
ncbi:MAG: hypothetical protein CL927_01005 [Deltaproteobacteria bacterium]|nr:hypothetical protein [Deltaproteobacteria bacterium]HCH62714.1 hypothetical protein [Deltaproteobacteria bacterium]